MRPPGALLPVVCSHGSDGGTVEGPGGCPRYLVVGADGLGAACPEHPDVAVDLTPPAALDLSGVVCLWDGERNLLAPAAGEPHADPAR